MTKPTSELLELAIKAGKAASEKIMSVYQSDDFDVEIKGDQSPLTRADKLAHQAIVQILHATSLPILSEEGKEIPFAERRKWKRFWLVDPLDGTKEFIKRNGDFTVNIALIEDGVPILGVVIIPVADSVYYSTSEEGSFVMTNGSPRKMSLRKKIDRTTAGIRVVASRSHMSPETESFISQLNQPQLLSKGSSLKFLLVADGEADLYPRFGPTMEWDTAAAHAIVNGVGLCVNDLQGNELTYNKENLVNPSFLVE